MAFIKSLGSPSDALKYGRKFSPYIDGLCNKFSDFTDIICSTPSDELVADLIKEAKEASNMSLEDGQKALRIAKSKLHLALAAFDLSRGLKTMQVTKYLSDFADCTIETALEMAIKDASDRDRRSFAEDGTVPGLFIIAMGKHGAHELNYSSDLDLAAFFDREQFSEDYQDKATAICVRIIGSITRIMDTVTADNYVFRIDWRLRPDPLSTPLAVSLQAAEIYYESVGQNWERAAMIKARPIAGRKDIAADFLKGLEPFIWRKYLDFAAILDISSILRQIHQVNRSVDFDNPAFNVKLGRGGIREIEFFTQTQQLILGGKDKGLRQNQTLDALAALCSRGRISSKTYAELISAYRFLRSVEHRVQMINDEQTHSLPDNVEKRARVAALCGYEDLKSFDKIIKQTREMVRDNVSALFSEIQPLSDKTGSLIFTGVDDDPETIETLSNLGYKAPKIVSQTIRLWHHGRIRATRSPRAREILTDITPTLLYSIAKTSDPDVVFSRFSDFMEGLSAGVQTLALFRAEPKILENTCLTFALSPRLAEDLAKKPAILDAMLAPRFVEELNVENDKRQDIIDAQLINCDDFEFALDIVRRFKREEAFRIGYQLLHGITNGKDASIAYSDLAICCIRSLLPYAKKEVVNSNGNFDAHIAVCGWGKLSGRELSASSDLDIMLVYEPLNGAAFSDGDRPQSAESYFAKITQRLIAGLSVLTSEGPLYDVDMQLRPSGKKGPVAVRFSSFENYYDKEAWTWEFQALTRLVPLAGDKELCDKIAKTALDDLCKERDTAKIKAEIADMRKRIADNIKPKGELDVKRIEGGIIDIEFLTQCYELIFAYKYPDIINANTCKSLEKMAEYGIIQAEKVQRLTFAASHLNDVRQILDIVSGADFDAKNASDASKKAIAAVLEAPNFDVAMAILNDAREFVKSAWHECFNA